MKLSLEALAADLLRASTEIPDLQHEGLKKASEFAETEIKAMFGHYQDGWPELASATKEDRIAKGYPADEPLLRSGQLRDSYGHVVTGTTAHIGSDDKRAEWIEAGTARMPPRPILQTLLVQKGEQLAEIVGDNVAARIGGKAKGG